LGRFASQPRQKNMGPNQTPFRLNEGVWLEDKNLLIRWGTPIAELMEYLSPKINKQSRSVLLTWEDQTCFGGLSCDVGALQLDGPPNPRAYHIHLDTFHYASFRLRGITVSTLEEMAGEFKRIYGHLRRHLGEATFSYPNYQDGLPAIFWEFDEVMIAYAATGKEHFTISAEHEPDGYDDLKAEARAIRLREGEGARVNYVAW
jgi:hypothetical protein